MYVKIEDQKSKQQIQQTLDSDKNSQMHAFNETGTGVPAFLAKLWRLVDDPETNNLICWSKDGRSFIIQNQAQFARELLPLNYKHNNMASFIRQLNMYGFHKITSIDNGGLKFDRDEMEFSHPYFKRNCPYLLEHIKRKISNTKNSDDKSTVKTEAVTKVLQDVRAMRGRQDSLDSRFSIMKQENEALWREIASLRQKHAKQQQIVNKLIQFLITIVQPSRNMSGVKRHMQLMINDAPEVNFRKASESESDCGPVIHELGEELLEEAAEANDDELMNPISPYARSSVTHPDAESPSPLHMERPQSSISINSQQYDYSNQSAEDALGGGNFYSTSANQRNNSPTIVGGNGGVGIPALSNQANKNNGTSSVVQSVTPDGVQIVYHVTEVPDAPHPSEQDSAKGVVSFNDENVLTTPMVREQMARTQMLKQKNKQRRQQSDQAAKAAYKAPSASKAATASPSPVKIEPVNAEREIDPMLFLNTYDDNRRMTPDPRLISPNFSEDSTQSANINAGRAVNGNGNGASSISPRPGSESNGNMQLGTPNMYNTGDFITENIPNELFDDSSILSTGAGENSNFSGNFNLNEQQQYGLATARGGKFSYNVGGGATNCNSNAKSTNDPRSKIENAENDASFSTQALNLAAAMPSTSAAAATNILSSNENGNMAIAKYKPADGSGNGDGSGNANNEIMRLSTADEVHGHLENVQDELESLKELLRGDGYSLDANTLLSLIQSIQSEGLPQNPSGTLSNLDVVDIINKLGLLEGTSNQNNNNPIYTLDTELLNKLFNDSEVLGPYGLSIYGDLPNNMNQNAAKGSELISYQPSYDLSDILDKSEEGNSQAADSPLQLTVSNPNSSVLNTPCHE